MPNMSRIRKAQEATREAQEVTRQKKLRDTPYGRDIDEGKTTAAQYKAAYGTVSTPQGGGGHRGKIMRKKAAEGVLSNKSASVIPDDETASKIKAKRKKGTVYATARFKKVKSKKTGTTSTTDKTTTPGTDKTATKKKREKHTKRAARERFREAQKGKKPKTKKTKKTTKQEELEAAYGSPKDTERMMKHKNLKEGKVKSILKKFGKGK